MKIAVADLHPNPFRHVERYPIDQERVEALKNSIEKTGFWDNVVVRKGTNGTGGYEIAYGHHRLIALQEKRIQEVNLPVRDLDDTEMVLMMAQENMVEWGHSAKVEQETVRTIVEAYAADKIKLPAPSKDTPSTKLRAAPAFQLRGPVSSSGKERLYTAETIGKFLGWKPYKVQATISALAAIEEGLATDHQFKDVSTKQAALIVSEIRRTVKETGKPELAKAVGKQLAAGMKQAVLGHDSTGKVRKVQDVTIHNIRQHTNKMIQGQATVPKKKKIPPIEDFVDQLCILLADIPSDKMKAKLDAVTKFRSELSAAHRKRLVGSLRGAVNRFEKFATKIEED